MLACASSLLPTLRLSGVAFSFHNSILTSSLLMASLLSTHEPSVYELSVRETSVTLTGLLPPVAENKIQCWIRSRHVIYSAVERFTDCIMTLGGSVISVDSVGKIWMGNHRQVILYRVKASLHTPHHDLKQYWFKYGSLRTRFDPQI
jgi:phycoerythrin-associated linker protein